MRIRHGLGAAALCAAALFAPSSWGAFLSINETAGGVVFSGDANFSDNDWIGGTATQLQLGQERAGLFVQIFNPRGHAGIEVFHIFDTDGSLSDVLFLELTLVAGSIYQLHAEFCSEGAPGGPLACNPTGGPFTTVTEAANGDFGAFGTGLDPNLAIGGSSPEQAPEPISLALLGAGLAGLAWSRRRRS